MNREQRRKQKKLSKKNNSFATATIKLNDGTQTVVPLDGVYDMNDPKIYEKINQALKDM